MELPIHPLQSSEWMDFRREWGNEALKTKYGYLTLHKLPFINKKIGMFIRGPEPTAKMLADLSIIGKKNKLVFIKLEPFSKKTKGLVQLLINNNCTNGKTLFTPTSFWIDLTKSEQELLKGFESKTRYNIKYAQKKGVKVILDNSDKAFEEYLALMRETVERQGFYAHSALYHKLMWKHLKGDIANLLVAKKGDETLTAWIIFKYKNFLYYPYGASSMKYKNLQANSAMMWEAIKFGKSHKCSTFDLWGREEGKGFTKFKEGFNPEVVEFIGTWDLVINKQMYEVYKILENIRWIMLRTKSRFVKPKF